MMKTPGSTTIYYSSVPNDLFKEEKEMEATPMKRKESQSTSLSPRKTASTSISDVVVTSFNSARKMTTIARSLVPKLQCTPITSSRKGRQLDEVTPVIFYQDEDTVTKRVDEVNTSFIDPFSFGETESQDDNPEDGSETNSSVAPVKLFPDDAFGGEVDIPLSTVAGNINEKKDLFTTDEVVTFDVPIFTNAKFNEEDTSIDISEAIKSINAVSIVDEARSIRKSIRAKRQAISESIVEWEEPILSWDGFTKSSSFNKCQWEAGS